MKNKLETVYFLLPEIIQDLIFSIYGIYLRALRFGRIYGSNLNNLLESEWCSENEITRYQEIKFMESLRIAFDHSEFYKFWFNKHGVKLSDIKAISDIQKLPLSSKKDIRASGLSYHNNSIPKYALKKSLTSGTTGQSFTVYNTIKTSCIQWAIWGRHKKRFNISMIRDKYLMFGARVPISLNSKRIFRKDFGLNRRYLTIYKLSESNFEKYIDCINNYRYDFIAGYPSSILLLANYILQNNITLLNYPKVVITGSDALFPETKKSIAKAFRAEVTDQYGMAEGCGNFSQCELGRYHLDFEMGFPEFIDMSENPNSNIKHLVFTSLSNIAMPLIRYDTGDLVIPTNEKCNCGRKSIVVERIVGREEDYILTPEGNKIQGLNQVFEYANNIDMIQVYQENIDSIEVRYVKGLKFENQVLDRLKYELNKRIQNSMKINFIDVQNIPLTKSGKYKAVVSKINL